MVDGGKSLMAPIKPYLTYAQQMRQTVPIMAYHCKFYAVQKGLKLCNENPGETADKAKSLLI